MRFREFIRQNREDIDRMVWHHTMCRFHQPQRLTTDKERAEWVMNDEELYRWAQQAVKGL